MKIYAIVKDGEYYSGMYEAGCAISDYTFDDSYFNRAFRALDEILNDNDCGLILFDSVEAIYKYIKLHGLTGGNPISVAEIEE